MNGPSDMQPARAEPIRLTYQDYLRFPDDGLRHELIDGEHFVTPTPVLRHQLVSERLGWELGAWVRASKNGQVFYAPFDVILSDFDVVEPDIMWISNERRDILKKWAFGAPDLVVEILSPTTRRRDEAHKLRLYDRSGVREYWLADPDAGDDQNPPPIARWRLPARRRPGIRERRHAHDAASPRPRARPARGLCRLTPAGRFQRAAKAELARRSGFYDAGREGG